MIMLSIILSDEEVQEINYIIFPHFLIALTLYKILFHMHRTYSVIFRAGKCRDKKS